MYTCTTRGEHTNTCKYTADATGDMSSCTSFITQNGSERRGTISKARFTSQFSESTPRMTLKNVIETTTRFAQLAKKGRMLNIVAMMQSIAMIKVLVHTQGATLMRLCIAPLIFLTTTRKNKRLKHFVAHTWSKMRTRAKLLVALYCCIPHIHAVQTQIATFGGCTLYLDDDGVLSSSGTCEGTADILELSGKGIKSLASEVFVNMSSMRGLFLNDNALTVLPTGIFDPLTKLTYVPLFPRHARVLGVEHLYQWHVFFRVL